MTRRDVGRADDRVARLRERARRAAEDASRRIVDVSEHAEAAFRARVASPKQGNLVPADDAEASSAASSAWSALAAAGVQIAIAAAKGGTTGAILVDPAVTLIQAMLGIEDGQRRLLTTIDRNVVLLRDGPFTTGRLYLREAERLAGDEARSRGFVERAESKFYDAVGLAASPLDLAVVGMHVGLCAMLLGRPEDARHWLEEAYHHGSGVAEALAERTGNTKVLKTKWGTAAATYMYPVGVVLLVKKGLRVRKDEQARRGLDEVLPVVACIASMYNALPGVALALPTPALIPLGNDRFELR
jgi:hypothetical protein